MTVDCVGIAHPTGELSKATLDLTVCALSLGNMDSRQKHAGMTGGVRLMGHE